MVRTGQVRELDKVSNDKADQAADSWRRGVEERVTDSRVIEAVKELAMLPGPEAFWARDWQGWPDVSVTADDARYLPIF